MNLRKTLVASIAVLGLMASVAAPAAHADESVNGHAPVNETGTFVYWWWYGNPTGSGIGFTLPSTNVNTTTGGTATYSNQYLEVQETHATSAGYELQVSATNFISGTHSIANTNFSITDIDVNPGFPNCKGTLAPNPGNAFQTVDTAIGNLGSEFNLIDGSIGRGCGAMTFFVDFSLVIPAGTYTGGTSTSYTSTVTLTDLLAP